MSKPEPAAVFAALGDRTRLGLLARLSTGAASITELSHGGPLTRQAVTKHLAVLEQAGLVRAERIGRERRFAGRPETLDAARAYLAKVSADWDAALERLRAHVEG